MEKLVVMDFSDSSISVYSVNDSDDRTPEDILTELGHNMDDCSIMWCESDIRINIKG